LNDEIGEKISLKKASKSEKKKQRKKWGYNLIEKKNENQI
jgi:hypothetical protein